MKRKESRRRIRIFLGILVVPTLLWLLLSLVGIAKHLDFETGEKRNKHVMAEGTGLSDLTTELEACYNDRVPFRSILLKVNSTLNWIVELPYSKVVEPVLIHIANSSLEKQASTQQYPPTDSSAPAESQPIQPSVDPAQTAEADQAVTDQPATDQTGSAEQPDTETAVQNTEEEDAKNMQEASSEESNLLPILPPYYESPENAGYYPYKELAPEVIQGRDNWLFTTESFADFTGGNMPNQEQLLYKLQRMELLNQLCQNKGIELHIVAMPNKATVYPEYMPTLEQASPSAVNVLEEYMHANSNVSFNFLDDALLGAKVYGQLYYKHDTHWNNRGGLVAVAYMHNFLGLAPVDIGSVKSGVLEPYYGDLATYSGLPSASFEQEDSIEMYYKMDIPQTMLRGGDDYIDEVVAENAESDKTLVMVGDSYRHSLLPFISRDYAHVYSISQTKMNDEVADILANADIILLEGVERNFFTKTYFDETVETLIQMLS